MVNSQSVACFLIQSLFSDLVKRDILVFNLDNICIFTEDRLDTQRKSLYKKDVLKKKSFTQDETLLSNRHERSILDCMFDED